MNKREHQKARQEWLGKLKKDVSPPTTEKELLPMFIDWSRQHGLDYKEEKLGGKNYQRFLKELVTDYKKACQRAEVLVHLIKVELSKPIGFGETSRQYFKEISWNSCLIEAIKTGLIPKRHQREAEKPAEQAYEAGWNEARKKLKQDFKDLLKAR